MKKTVQILFILSLPLPISAVAMDQAACKTNYEAVIPTLKSISEGNTPAPKSSAKLAAERLKIAQKKAESGDYCSAFNALIDFNK